MIMLLFTTFQKELTTLSKLKDYEFDPTYKAIAKDIAQLSPNVPDTVIDLGDSNFLIVITLKIAFYLSIETLLI